MPYALQPDEPTGDALPRIAVEMLDKAVAALSSPDGVTAVHETRKSCKRVRALLRMYRPGLGPCYRAANSEVRDVARLLSASRDEDVLPMTCDKLLGKLSDQETRGAVESVRDTLLAAEKDQATNPVDAVIERLQSLSVEARGWRVEQARRSAADGVKRVYRDGRRHRKACAVDGAATAWHEWRKSVKHHGYHASLLKKLHPVADAYVEPWDRLGKLLGDEHDLSVLEERLVKTTLSDEPLARLALEATRDRRAAVREKAARLGQRLYRPSPRIVRAVVRELLPK